MKANWMPYALADLPRYTSYPTAVQFSDGVGEAETRYWLTQAVSAESLSLYFHIPFCRQLCWYCGCHTYVVNKNERIEGYVALLEQEMDLVLAALGQSPKVAAIHFGGGTPNFLSPDQWRRLSKAIHSRFELMQDAEIACELDPRTLSAEQVEVLAESGVNRASLGVQSFQPAVQAAINRVQCPGLVRDAVDSLRRAGIAKISFDLMYGLPHQSLADMAETTRLAVDMQPDCLAVFGYAHVPWMKKHQRAIDEASLPGARARWDQAEVAAKELTGAGYQRIGFDHYARPGDEMAKAAVQGTLRRNFQGYTTDPSDTLLAFGASAISSLPGGYSQNLKELPRWADAIRAGHLPVARGIALTPDDKLRRLAIERLLCDLKLDFGALCRQVGVEETALDSALPRLQELARDGLIRMTAERAFYLEPEAIGLARHAAAAFDARRQVGAKRHSKAV